MILINVITNPIVFSNTYGKSLRIKRRYFGLVLDIFIPLFWAIILYFKDFFNKEVIFYYETRKEINQAKLEALNYNYINRERY